MEILEQKLCPECSQVILKQTNKKKQKKNLHREFPGGLVGRTWHFHGSGLGSIPDCGMKIPQAIQCGQ